MDDYQKISEKITAISADSTDSQYPSAKAVVDYVATKADSEHTHDDRYYTEDETDSLLSQKSQVQIITQESSEVLQTLKIHKLTQEEYEQEIANGTIDENALYLTPDEAIDLTQYETKTDASEKLNEAKAYADIGDTTTLESAKTYVDNAISNMSQVQIITWEDDD